LPVELRHELFGVPSWFHLSSWSWTARRSPPVRVPGKRRAGGRFSPSAAVLMACVSEQHRGGGRKILWGGARDGGRGRRTARCPPVGRPGGGLTRLRRGGPGGAVAGGGDGSQCGAGAEGLRVEAAGTTLTPVLAAK